MEKHIKQVDIRLWRFASQLNVFLHAEIYAGKAIYGCSRHASCALNLIFTFLFLTSQLYFINFDNCHGDYIYITYNVQDYNVLFYNNAVPPRYM
jgi:hypothetical protein